MEWIYTSDELDNTAAAWWNHVGDARVFAFHGPMGAGKTTLIAALCRAKNVADNIGSPTFSIINQYAYPDGIIYHLDLYRLRSEEDAIRAGVEDAIYSGSICMVEWPEIAPGIFPPDTLHTYIEPVNPLSRKIRMAVHA